MVERPFPCTSDEVRAIRSNLKTQSRSLRGLQKINAEPDAWEYRGFDSDDQMHIWHSRNSVACYTVRCPWGVAGDRLWVQETISIHDGNRYECGVGYRADHPHGGDLSKGDGGYNFRSFADDPLIADTQRAWAEGRMGSERWIPSTQMPRWASRDTLENVSVKPERLQSITDADAVAEGAQGPGFPADLTNRGAFSKHWNLRYGKAAPWAENKWVWRIEHRRVNER